MLRKNVKPGWCLIDGKGKYWDGKKWLETEDMSEPKSYEAEDTTRYWDGESLVSNELNPIVLEEWNIEDSTNVGAFKASQGKYLEFHRDKVFNESHG